MRIGATEIDGYLYWKRTEQPLDEFLRRLRKEEPPTEAMLMGNALHTALELARTGTELTEVEISVLPDDVRPQEKAQAIAQLSNVDVPDQRYPTYRFHLDDLNGTLALPAIRELKAEWHPPGMPDVTIAMVADGLEGRTVYEHKLSQRWDMDQYAEAMQWRLYLLGFEADCVRYNVFIRNNRPGPDVWIYDLHTFAFWGYASMEADVVRVISEFADFLGRHLPERLEG